MPIIKDMATGVVYTGPRSRRGNDIFGNAADITAVGSQLAQGYNQTRSVDQSIANSQADNIRADQQMGMARDQFGYKQEQDAIENARRQQMQDAAIENIRGDNERMAMREAEDRLREAANEAADRENREAFAAAAGSIIGAGEYPGGPFPVTPPIDARLPLAQQQAILNARLGLEKTKMGQETAQQRIASMDSRADQSLDFRRQQAERSNEFRDRGLTIQERNASNYAANTGASSQNREIARKLDGIQTNIRVAMDRMKAAGPGTEGERQAQEDLAYWTAQLNDLAKLPTPSAAPPPPAQQPGFFDRLFGGSGAKTPDQLADEAIARGITDPNQIKEYIRRGGQ